MVEVSNWGARIPHLTQKASVIDVDVHEGLPSVQDLALAMVETMTEGGAPTRSSYELMRDQPVDAYEAEYAILVSALQPTDVRAQPKLATALASTHSHWSLKNRLKRFSRKTCLLAHGIGRCWRYIVY